MTLFGWILSIGLAAFGAVGIVFSLRTGKEQRLLDEWKQRGL